MCPLLRVNKSFYHKRLRILWRNDFGWQSPRSDCSLQTMGSNQQTWETCLSVVCFFLDPLLYRAIATKITWALSWWYRGIAKGGLELDFSILQMATRPCVARPTMDAWWSFFWTDAFMRWLLKPQMLKSAMHVWLLDLSLAGLTHLNGQNDSWPMRRK